MNMKKRIIALFAAGAMLISGMALTTSATEGDATMEVLVEESFDDYSAGTGLSLTTLSQYFTLNADSIGPSWIKIVEDTDIDGVSQPTGTLALQGCRFTECYIKEPISTGYVFSLDVWQAQGSYAHSVFTRAAKPAGGNFFTENFAIHEDERQYAHNATGISFHGANNENGAFLRVVVRGYDASSANKCVAKQMDIPLPSAAGDAFRLGQTLKIVDNNSKMDVYIEDTLMCTITMTNPGQIYSGSDFGDAFFGNVTVSNAMDASSISIDNSYVTSDSACFGWSTRNCYMAVDNILVMVPPQGGEVVNPPSSETNAPVVTLPSGGDDPDPTEPADTDPAEPVVTDPAEPVVTDPIDTEPGDTEPSDTVADESEAETKAETKAPSTNTNKPKRGCGGVIGLGAMGVLMTSAAAAVALKKRK